MAEAFGKLTRRPAVCMGTRMVGGGNLVAQFARRGLLDEIWLAVIPLVLGAGAPLLPAAVPGPLELTEVTRFPRGVIELRYAVPASR